MTDERLAALEVVAEAARMFHAEASGPGYAAGRYTEFRHQLGYALRALDAVPAPQPQPAGNVVEVRAAVMLHNDGLLSVMGQQTDGTVWAGTKRGDWVLSEDPRVIATLTARVPLPTVPVIPATVERGE